MVANKSELVSLIMCRDGISRNEAANIIEECQREIDDAIFHGGSLDLIEDIIADYLQLEPDYLDLFIS